MERIDINPNVTRGPVWSPGTVNQAYSGLMNTQAPAPVMGGGAINPAQQGALSGIFQGAVNQSLQPMAHGLRQQMQQGNMQHNLRTNQLYNQGAQAGADLEIQRFLQQLGFDTRSQLMAQQFGSQMGMGQLGSLQQMLGMFL